MKYLIALIKLFEGCFLKAYLCPARVWTCGWGSTGPDVREGVEWTQEQADDRMEKDAIAFYVAALRASPTLHLNEKIHGAVSDFCYNLGTGRYKSSTFKKRIDEGDYESAIHELQKWTRGGGKILPGLVKRRMKEGDLIMQGAQEVHGGYSMEEAA